MRGMRPQSGQYLHSWGRIVIDGIRAMPWPEVWAPHVRTLVPVWGVDCSDLKRGVLHFMEFHIT